MIHALRVFTEEMGKALTSWSHGTTVALRPQEKAKGKDVLGTLYHSRVSHHAHPTGTKDLRQVGSWVHPRETQYMSSSQRQKCYRTAAAHPPFLIGTLLTYVVSVSHLVFYYMRSCFIAPVKLSEWIDTQHLWISSDHPSNPKNKRLEVMCHLPKKCM